MSQRNGHNYSSKKKLKLRLLYNVSSFVDNLPLSLAFLCGEQSSLKTIRTVWSNLNLDVHRHSIMIGLWPSSGVRLNSTPFLGSFA